MAEHAQKHGEGAHGAHGHHDHAHSVHEDEAGLAELLDLDAEVLGSYLDEATEWAAQLAPEAPRTIADLGAGTGVGTLALARRFTAAEVIAVDVSEQMLERVGAAALAQGLGDRMRLVQADMNEEWPPVGPLDLAWASSSVHELDHPDRLFRDVFSALNPDGLLVVVELENLPRFLPDDVGFGRPGLEIRAHEALSKVGWNPHQDWRPHLVRAGFEIVGERRFTSAVTAGAADASGGPSKVERYARSYLRRIRLVLDDQLARDDLDTLDRLLADDALFVRGELTARTERIAWAARRP